MAVQRDQRVGGKPVQRVLVRAFGKPAGEGRVAEILDDEKALRRVFGVDFRRAEPEGAKMPGDPHEGRGILLRRRRIHQQGRGRPAGEAEIAPEGRVARERRHPRVPPIRAGEETAAGLLAPLGHAGAGTERCKPVEQRPQPARPFAAAVTCAVFHG